MIIEGYIVGLGRDAPDSQGRHMKVAHLYKGTMSDPGWPMCRRGWNRDDGTSYSIWRNNVGESGVCAVCTRRALENRDSVPPRDVSEVAA